MCCGGSHAVTGFPIQYRGLARPYAVILDDPDMRERYDIVVSARNDREAAMQATAHALAMEWFDRPYCSNGRLTMLADAIDVTLDVETVLDFDVESAIIDAVNLSVGFAYAFQCAGVVGTSDFVVYGPPANIAGDAHVRRVWGFQSADATDHRRAPRASAARPVGGTG
jgi:hypothetical protein